MLYLKRWTFPSDEITKKISGDSAAKRLEGNMDKPLHSLIEDRLKSIGRGEDFGTYKEMLDMLLPASITEQPQNFYDLSTNVGEVLKENNNRRNNIFKLFDGIDVHVTEIAPIAGGGGAQRDVTCINAKAMYDTATEADKAKILQMYERKYKMMVLELCYYLISDDNICDKLNTAINDQEFKSAETRKMYFEALFHYMLVEIFKKPVRVNFDTFDSKTFSSVKSKIITAIDIVSNMVKGKKPAKNVPQNRNIYNELKKFTALCDRTVSIEDDMELTFNDKVIEDAESSSVEAFTKREEIIENLKTAFDNMQAAPINGGPEIANNETFRHKGNVIKTCRKVCDKILSSENTSPELVRKFFKESVIGKTIDKTYRTPQHLVDVTNPENKLGVVGTVQAYYTGDGTGLREESKRLRKDAVANRALQDDEFRKRLDEEIKAKHQSDPTYFAFNLHPDPFGLGLLYQAFNNPDLCNVYTKQTCIAHSGAMDYIESFYVKDVERRLDVFDTASDLQKEDDTKWIGEEIVDFRPGFWLTDEQFKDFKGYIIDCAKRMFSDSTIEVDVEVKKGMLKEIISNINETSLKIRNIDSLKAKTSDIFARVSASIASCTTENEIKELKTKSLKKILEYRQDSDAKTQQFKNVFNNFKQSIFNYEFPLSNIIFSIQKVDCNAGHHSDYFCAVARKIHANIQNDQVVNLLQSIVYDHWYTVDNNMLNGTFMDTNTETTGLRKALSENLTYLMNCKFQDPDGDIVKSLIEASGTTGAELGINYAKYANVWRQDCINIIETSGMTPEEKNTVRQCFLEAYNEISNVNGGIDGWYVKSQIVMRVLKQTMKNLKSLKFVDSRIKYIHDGVDILGDLLMAKVSDEREFFETSRAITGMVNYIVNGTGTWDEKNKRFDKFSDFVKECLEKNNTQDIINYAKIHLKEFVLHKLSPDDGRGETQQGISGDAERADMMAVLNQTSVDLNNNQFDEAWRLCSGNVGKPESNGGLSDLIKKHTQRVYNFTDPQINVNPNSNILMYTACKRLSDGLKYFLSGNVGKLKECLGFTTNGGTFSGTEFHSNRVGTAGTGNNALLGYMYELIYGHNTVFNGEQKDILKKLFVFYDNDVRRNGAEANLANRAVQLRVKKLENMDDISKAIKLLDDKAKERLPEVSAYFCATNTPSSGGHTTNANTKLHMLGYPKSQSISQDLLPANGRKPFDNYKDNGIPVAEKIDNDALMQNGIYPTSLFWQHNKSLGLIHVIKKCEITETADEVINPVVKKIVLTGMPADNTWWNVDDVGRLNRMVEQYGLAEKDIDELFNTCPFLLSCCDFDILDSYFSRVCNDLTLKNSPDLKRTYVKQLQQLSEQISLSVMGLNFTDDAEPVKVSNNQIKQIIINVLKKCTNAHQLNAVKGKLKKAKKKKNDLNMLNGIANGTEIDNLPSLESSAKATQVIEVKKGGSTYKLDVLKTKMNTDPTETAIVLYRAKKRKKLLNIRRKFLNKDGNCNAVFGELGDDYQVYLEVDYDNDDVYDNRGDIVIAGKLDEYNVRHVKQLPYKQNKADYNAIKEKYITDICFYGKSDSSSLSVDINGTVCMGNNIVCSLSSDFAKEGREFLQTCSAFANVFGCKDKNNLRDIVQTIHERWKDGRQKGLLSALVALKKNLCKTKCQDIIQLLRNDEYKNVFFPFDAERVKVMVQLVKFKRDFMADTNNSKQLCDNFIDYLTGANNISLCSKDDCKKLFSFINPFVAVYESVNFFKGTVGEYIKQPENKNSTEFFDGVLKHKRPNKEVIEQEEENKEEEEKKEEDKKNAKDGTDDKKEEKEKKENQQEEEKNTEEKKKEEDEKEEQQEDEAAVENAEKEEKKRDNVHDDEDDGIGATDDKKEYDESDYNLHDKFGIKYNDRNDSKKDDNSIISTDDEVDRVSQYYLNKIRNSELGNKTQNQGIGSGMYNNIPQMQGSIYNNIQQPQINYGGNNVFNAFANAKQDQNYNGYPASGYQTSQPMQRGGALKDMFRRQYIRTNRREKYFANKQNGAGGNILQAGYTGNSSSNTLYNGYQPRGLNNNNSVYGQYSGSNVNKNVF